jgi:outer membrane murein-binding lipoprotein Lpp
MRTILIALTLGLLLGCTQDDRLAVADANARNAISRAEALSSRVQELEDRVDQLEARLR